MANELRSNFEKPLVREKTRKECDRCYYFAISPSTLLNKALNQEQLPDLKNNLFDLSLANPPINICDTKGSRLVLSQT